MTEQVREKKANEKFLRGLWRDCFQDPPEYENFYFQWVYPKNIVFMEPDKGMLHLNPYLCDVGRKKCCLHYVVGVATGKEYRRQGVMREMLADALSFLYEGKEPFTYLMPADTRYYEPFSFVSVTRKKQRILYPEPDGLQAAYADPYQFHIYRQDETPVCWDKWEQTTRQWLRDQYAVYAIHDRAYYELLQREKRCQGGEVVFVTGGDRLLGMFAYVPGETSVYIEQQIWNVETEEAELLLRKYFAGVNDSEMVLIEQYPYMLRLVHLDSFVSCFPALFSEYAARKICVKLTDAMLPQNTGIYTFENVNGRIRIEKRETETEQLLDHTPESLVREALRREKACFFAEII